MRSHQPVQTTQGGCNSNESQREGRTVDRNGASSVKLLPARSAARELPPTRVGQHVAIGTAVERIGTTRFKDSRGRGRAEARTAGQNDRKQQADRGHRHCRHRPALGGADTADVGGGACAGAGGWPKPRRPKPRRPVKWRAWPLLAARPKLGPALGQRQGWNEAAGRVCLVLVLVQVLVLLSLVGVNVGFGTRFLFCVVEKLSEQIEWRRLALVGSSGWLLVERVTEPSIPYRWIAPSNCPANHYYFKKPCRIAVHKFIQG